MKRRSTVLALTTLTMMALFGTLFAGPSPTRAGGVTQISGVGAFSAPGECNDPQGDGSDYSVAMTGDLTGCHYTFVEVSRCSQGRAYFEAGTEIFVGTYDGASGTFGTSYVFTAVYENCPAFGQQIAGRCQHPVTAGSGTDVFEGVRGRVDMRDDPVTGTFSYRGHLAFDDPNNQRRQLPFEDSLNLTRLQILGSGGC